MKTVLLWTWFSMFLWGGFFVSAIIKGRVEPMGVVALSAASVLSAAFLYGTALYGKRREG